MKKGLLLIALGTPLKANRLHIAKFLYLFLNDPMVITLPYILRIILLFFVILPLRTTKTLHAYKKIWTTRGSPLMIYSLELTDKLEKKLGKQYQVILGMRYGDPSIKNALSKFKRCQEITVLPLYPQYAEATTGSAISYISKITKNASNFKFIRSFYNDSGFIHALADKIRPLLPQHDFLLLSYHGLPESQIKKSGCATICQEICDLKKNDYCYRAQCFATSDKLANILNLKPFSRLHSQQFSSSVKFATSFQSRMGLLPWIQPYTTDTLKHLRLHGYENLLIVCPSFVTDCLETLEEIDIRARELWQSLGGKTFTLVKSLNSDTAWVDAIADLIKK